MAVSRWPASAAAVVAVVASSPRCCAQCAIKFAHRAENTPKLVFLDLLGELCRGSAVGGASLGVFSRIPALRPGIRGDVVPYMRERVGFLHYMKPSGCVSSACRSLM